MAGLFKRMINKYHYSVESIKNRYPCKIIKIKNLDNFSKPTEIQYLAATKLNIRTSTTQSILNDKLLVEKFHPTDGVKLGFLACGEIILKEDITIQEARALYQKVIKHMFEDII